jgi:outer membrane protein, heavy metal efflux system
MLPLISRAQANAITGPAIVVAFVGLGIAGCVRYSAKPLVPEQTATKLESRSFSDAGLRTFIEKNLGHPLTQWPLKSWNLELLTLVAFYYSPELDVARARWSAADATVVSAGTRPNPSLTITPEYAINTSPGILPWLPMVALDVPIETAGKRAHRVTQAQQLSESARWSVVTSAWEVRRNLTGALLDYTVGRNRERLLERQLDLQAHIVRLEEGELTAGAVAGSDITVARVQFAKTRLDLEATRARVAEARTRSADALGIPLHALEGTELTLEFDTTDAFALTSGEARRRALLGRSDVMGALAEYEASQAALQLEIAKQYPDSHLGPGYQWDQGQNDWLIGLTFELPVFNRNQGPIGEAAAHRTEAAARFMALQAQIIHEIDAATSALKTADEAARAAEDMLAAQRQNLEAVEGQLNAGAVGALEVASAQIDAVNAETLTFEASARRQQAVRALEDAVQRPLGSEADARATVLQIESTQRSPR